MLDGREVRDKQGRQGQTLQADFMLYTFCQSLRCVPAVFVSFSGSVCVLVSSPYGRSGAVGDRCFRLLRAEWDGKCLRVAPPSQNQISQKTESRVGRKVPPRCTAVPKSDISTIRTCQDVRLSLLLNQPCSLLLYVGEQQFTGGARAASNHAHRSGQMRRLPLRRFAFPTCQDKRGGG